MQTEKVYVRDRTRRIYSRRLILIEGYQFPMSHAYDVLRMTEKGPEWVDTAPDLEAAKAKIRERAKTNPGSYLLFNQRTQEQVLIELES
jgi:hypothetical protein